MFSKIQYNLINLGFQFYILLLVDLIQIILIIISALFFLTNIHKYLQTMNVSLFRLHMERKNL